MADRNSINPRIVASLLERFALNGPECVRYINDPDYDPGAIECYGRMPNTAVTGWFFAGYECDMEAEPQAATFVTQHGSNAADLMTALDGLEGVEIDQDWENESTTWTFDDGSRIRISGPEVEVEAAPTARGVLADAGYSAEDIDAGMAYADMIGWLDEDDRGALALARILYDDAELSRSPRAPWEPCCGGGS